MARGAAKKIAEQAESGQPENLEQDTAQLEGDELMKLNEDFTSGDDPATSEDDHEEEDADEEGDDAGWVVVSKGHTLYHNGEKYQQFQRLKMDAGDAAPLLKNGVIVAYSDLLKQVSRNGD